MAYNPPYNYTYSNQNTDLTVATSPLTGTNGIYKSGTALVFFTGASQSGISGKFDIDAGSLVFKPAGTTTVAGISTTWTVASGSFAFIQPQSAGAVLTVRGNFIGPGAVSVQGDVAAGTGTFTGSVANIAEARAYGQATASTLDLPVYGAVHVWSFNGQNPTFNVAYATAATVGTNLFFYTGNAFSPTLTFNVNGSAGFVSSGYLRRNDAQTTAVALILGGTQTAAFNAAGQNGGTGVTNVTKQGGSVYTFGASNTAVFNGTFSITGGGVKLTNSDALGTASVTMSALTTLELTNASPTNSITLIGNVTSSGGNNTLSSGMTLAGATTLNVTADSLTLSGAIIGSTAVSKTGTGVATLSNASNGFTSNPNISEGTLAVPTIAALGAGTGLTLSGDGVLRYTGTTGGTLSRALTGTSLSGGGFENTGGSSLAITGSGSLSGTIKLGASNSASQYNTLTTTISSGGFTKDGLGRWIVTSFNNLASPTTVSAGTLMAAPPTATASEKLLGGNVTVSAGAKIQIGSDNGQKGRNYYSSLTFAGTVGTPARIRIGGSAVNPTVQMSGNLTISGPVTWDLTADTFKTPGTYTLIEFASGALLGSIGDVTVQVPAGRSVPSGGLVYDAGVSPKTITVTVN